MRDSPAELWLFDYHLDTGPQVRAAVHEAGLPLLMKPLALKSALDRLLAARAVR